MTDSPNQCLNCGAAVQDSYCSVCGQATRPPSRTVVAFLGEFFDNYLFTADSKLTRTVGLLLFRPGQATRTFLAGQRAAQLPPVRTYLILVLLVFFFVPPMGLPPAEEYNVSFEGRAIGEQIEGRRPFGVGIPRAVWIPLGLLEPRFDEVRERFSELDDPAVLFDLVDWRLQSVFPNLMLLIVPFIGLVLWIMHWGSKRPLFDHLLFALHLQSFAIAAILLLTLIDHLIVWGAIALGLNPWFGRPFMTSFVVVFPVALWRSLYVVYGAGWLRTTLRFVLLLIVYGGIAMQIHNLTWVVTFLLV